MEGLVLHENHVSNFKTAHKVLNRRSQIATTSPDILNKCDIVRGNAKGLCQPSVVELNALILEEVIILKLVENLDAEHDEARVMATGQTDVVQIIEASAELWANERVGRRVELSCNAVGLEAVDASGDIVDVISPACHDRVPFNAIARDPGCSETFLEAYKQNKSEC